MMTAQILAPNEQLKKCLSEDDLNSSKRPNTIAKSQNHLITHERLIIVVNRSPENQDIYKRKNRSEKQVII